MTTEVTIKMTTPHNHKDIMVDVINGFEGETSISDSKRVRDGEEISLFVYDTQSLAIREVDKDLNG